MFPKVMVVLLTIAGLCALAHHDLARSSLLDLESQNETLTSHCKDADAKVQNLEGFKDRYCKERDSAVAELDQLKAMASAVQSKNQAPQLAAGK
jgi:hypothetical protein